MRAEPHSTFYADAKVKYISERSIGCINTFKSDKNFDEITNLSPQWKLLLEKERIVIETLTF